MLICLDSEKIVRMITVNVDVFFSLREWSRYYSGESYYNALLQSLTAFVATHGYDLKYRDKDYCGTPSDKLVYFRPEGDFYPDTQCVVTFKLHDSNVDSKIRFNQAIVVDGQVGAYSYEEGLELIANSILLRHFRIE